MTVDKQLKTTYNSIAKAHSAIFSHWCKFKCWMQDVVLHEDSDCLKLLNEFTVAHQCVNEDPNQFYLCLFNLGIQLKCTINVDEYWTCLVKSLQNLISQQDWMYSNVQEVVIHAEQLWQTLDSDKVQQEIRDDRDKACQCWSEFFQQLNCQSECCSDPQQSK